MIFVNSNSDLTLSEFAKHIKKGISYVCEAFKRLRVSRKKKSLRYKDRDEKKKAIFLDELSSYPKEMHIFVDESGIDTYFHRSHGWAKKGALVYGEISRKRSKKSIELSDFNSPKKSLTSNSF
jgi:putative transposase